jgi:Na+-transporting methylmalonyl-CoA/oxaloacetate decarboxylase gamma subunit
VCSEKGGKILITALWMVLLGMAIIFVVLGVLLGMMLLLNKFLEPEAKENVRQ